MSSPIHEIRIARILALIREETFVHRLLPWGSAAFPPLDRHGCRDKLEPTICRRRADMTTDAWTATAHALVSPGKGILAADESHSTIARRFEAVGVPNTEENRRIYRQMLFTTKGAAEFISGVILFDETIRQKADDGSPLAEVLSR